MTDTTTSKYRQSKFEKFSEAAMGVVMFLAMLFIVFCLWQISEGLAK